MLAPKHQLTAYSGLCLLLRLCSSVIMAQSPPSLPSPASQAPSRARLTLDRLAQALKLVDLSSAPLTQAHLTLTLRALTLMEGAPQDPLELEGVTQDLLDALGLEAGRCSGELERLRRALRWLQRGEASPLSSAKER